MPTSLILHARATGEGRALPLALAGHPAEIEGKPVHYRRKEVIADGQWVHRGQRKPFDINPARTQLWQENFARRLSAGIKTPILKRHTENPAADDVLGYIVGLERQGEKVFADFQFIGDDALSLAARNDVSIYEKAEGIDAKGNPFGLFLDHIALTPNPNQPHLGPFVTIAASAGGSAVDVPVYESAAAQQETPMLKPETLTALRSKLPGLKSGATDAEVAEAAAALALNPPADPQVTALSASVQTLTSERDAAIADRDAQKAQVLALSAGNKAPDPLVLSMFGETFEAKAETAIEAGVPKAAVDYYSALFRDTTGKTTPLALSACSVPAGEGKVKEARLGIAVLDGLAKLYKGGFGEGVTPGQVAPGDVLALSANDTDRTKDNEYMNTLRGYAGVPAK